MRKLAIKGHATRGKEVISILEMLGGNNNYSNYTGTNESVIYYINDEHEKYIKSVRILFVDVDMFTPFTLEEFESKFPYKVRDVVQRIDNDEKRYEIVSMRWTGSKIKYDACGLNCISNLYLYNAENLKPYKEQKTIEDDNILNQLIDYFNNTPREVVEKEWHEYDKYNKIGITVKDYLEYINTITKPNL